MSPLRDRAASDERCPASAIPAATPRNRRGFSTSDVLALALASLALAPAAASCVPVAFDSHLTAGFQEWPAEPHEPRPVRAAEALPAPEGRCAGGGLGPRRRVPRRATRPSRWPPRSPCSRRAAGSFASVNYRLSRPAAGAARTIPTTTTTWRAAVTWLRQHVRAGRAGTRSRIALLGHSAGADIVSNVAVNPAYLAAARTEPLTRAALLRAAGHRRLRQAPCERQGAAASGVVALGNLPGLPDPSRPRR